MYPICILLLLLLPPLASSQTNNTFIQGDVTSDGVLDGRDALKLFRGIEGLIQLTDSEKLAGDVFPATGTGGRLTGDGNLTQEDIERLLECAVGLIPEGDITGNYYGSTPTIRLLEPSFGPVGTAVTVWGAKFDSQNPADVAVFFDDIPAIVVERTPTRIVTRVPEGASTCYLRIRTPGGLAVSPAQFQVTQKVEGNASLGAGVNLQNFMIASNYEVVHLQADGRFSLSIQKDGVSIVGAVSNETANNTYLALSLPDSAGDANSLKVGANAAGSINSLKIDAYSTAVSFIFLHPFFITDNPTAVRMLTNLMKAVPEVQALADTIARRFPQGADGLNDSDVQNAWVTAVTAVMNALPDTMTYDLQSTNPTKTAESKRDSVLNLPGYEPLVSFPASADSSRRSPGVSPSANGELKLPVHFNGIDTDYILYSYNEKGSYILPKYASTYSPVDWLVTIHQIDPADMPLGINEAFQKLKLRPLRRIGTSQAVLLPAIQWTAKIDVLTTVTNLVFDKTFGLLGTMIPEQRELPINVKDLPIKATENRIYMIRAFSGVQANSPDQDMESIKQNGQDMYLSQVALAINLVNVVIDVWKFTRAEFPVKNEEKRHKFYRAVFQYVIPAVARQSGRLTGDLSLKEKLQISFDIVLEGIRGIIQQEAKELLANRDVPFGERMSKFQYQKLLGFNMVGTTLKVLNKISSLGRIGERLVGLSGYLINPLDREFSPGPTAVESLLVRVGDPFSPTLQSYSPGKGSEGTKVTLTGTRFAAKPENNEVQFVTNPGVPYNAKVLSVEGTTQMVVQVPRIRIDQPVTIQLETSAGSTPASLSNFQIQNAPVLEKLSPSAGYGPTTNKSADPFGDFMGTEVTLTGYYFNQNTQVYIGQTEAPIQQLQENTLTFHVPAMTPGLQDIYLVDKETLRESNRLSFTVYGPPIVNSIKPASAKAGHFIEVDGLNLSNCRVFIGTYSAYAIENDSTYIKVTMPNAGKVGDNLPMVVWTPAGWVQAGTILREAGVELPEIPKLPATFQLIVNDSYGKGENRNGKLSLDEAAAFARGEINLFGEGWDDKNEKWTHNFSEQKTGTDNEGNPIYEFKETSIDKETLQNNGPYSESREHYRVYRYHLDHGGNVTAPERYLTEDLDADPNVREEGDQMTVVGDIGAINLSSYDGSKYKETIISDGSTDPFVGSNLELGTYDAVDFPENQIDLEGGTIILKTGNSFKAQSLLLSSPIGMQDSYYISVTDTKIEASSGGGIHMTNCYGCNLSRVNLPNGGPYGILVEGGGQNRLEDIQVQKCSGDGIRLQDSDQNKIANPILQTNSGNGITIQRGFDNNVTKPSIQQCEHGIYLLDASNNSLYQTGAGGINSCRRNGITIQGGFSNEIREQVGNQNQGHGLAAIDSDSNTIVNSQFKGNTVGGLIVSGTASHSNEISSCDLGIAEYGSNQGTGNLGYGLCLQSGPANTLITNCRFFSNQGHGIVLLGDNTRYTHIANCDIGDPNDPDEAAILTDKRGNRGDGIHIDNGVGETTIENNRINGNEGHGISIYGSSTYLTRLSQNAIGGMVNIDPAQPDAIPGPVNRGYGVYVTGGAAFIDIADCALYVNLLGGILLKDVKGTPAEGSFLATITDTIVGQKGYAQFMDDFYKPPMGIGVYMENCQYVSINEVKIAGHQTGMRILGKESGHHVFKEILLRDCYGRGLDVEDSQEDSWESLSANNCGAEGIALKGVKWLDCTAPNAGGNTGTGFLMESCENISMQNYLGLVNIMANRKEGMSILDSRNIALMDWKFSENEGDGLIVDRNSSNIIVEKCEFNGNKGVGFQILNSSGVTLIGIEPFVGATFRDNEKGGMVINDSQNVFLDGRGMNFFSLHFASLTITGEKTENVIVSSVSFVATDHVACVYINGGRKIQFGLPGQDISNTIEFVQFAGLLAEGANTGLTIVNNRIGENPINESGTGEWGTQNGIILQNGIHDVTIANNLINANRSHGIWLREGAHSNKIYNNTISDNLGHGIFVEGASTRYNCISHNEIAGNGVKGIRLDQGNEEIAAPVIEKISYGDETVSGSISPTPPSGSQVEVFADDADEGFIFLGSSKVFGNNFYVQAEIPEDYELHAVAIHPNGNTSEFGPVEETAGKDLNTDTIVYSSPLGGNREIWAAAPHQATPVNLTRNSADDSDPQFSFSGDSILFCSDRSGNSDLWLQKLSDTAPVSFTNDPAPDYEPDWSPLSKRAVFVSERDGNPEIYSLMADPDADGVLFIGKEPAQVPMMVRAGNGFGGHFTTGGGSVVKLQFYISYDPAPFEWRIVSMQNDTPGETLASGKTTPTASGWHKVDIQPVEVPSQFLLGVIYLENNKPAIGATGWGFANQLWQFENGIWTRKAGMPYLIGVQMAATKPTRLTSNNGIDRYPAWSPDEKTIAFSSDRGGAMDIWIMNADGSNPHKTTDGKGSNTKPAWSPDGKQLVFVSDRDGNPELYRIDPDGSNLLRLTDNKEIDTDPVWSVNGKRILFSSNREAGFDIYSLSLQSQKATRLTYSVGDSIQPDAALSEIKTSLLATTSTQEIEEASSESSIRLAVNDASALPGETVKLSLSIAQAKQLGNLSFELEYDSSILTLVSLPEIQANQGSMFALNPIGFPDRSGRLWIDWIHAAGLEGDSPFLAVNFRIDSQTVDTETIVRLSNGYACDVFFNPIGVIAKDGIIALGESTSIPQWMLY